MSTWLGCIAATRGRADFWEIARRQGIEPLVSSLPAHALVAFVGGFDFEAPLRIAAALAEHLETTTLGFVVQTNADVHRLHAFHGGACVRKLDYSRDEGGWLADEGDVQPWEKSYFFDDVSTNDPDAWPDMLHDDLSDDDLARYEHARRAGDARPILELLHPSSTRAMNRVCEHFGVRADAPAGRWKRPSLLSRILGR